MSVMIYLKPGEFLTKFHNTVMMYHGLCVKCYAKHARCTLVNKSLLSICVGV